LPPQAEICVVTRTATERRSALPLAQMLRELGVRVEVDHRGSSIKSQMKRANRLGCSVVLILGEGELARGTVTVKRMDSSEQEEIPREELAPRVLEWLGSK
jgi:histidyl-tRNA synthetase